MALAVEAARRSGRVATAYCVGAVLVRSATGDVIATGFSREIPGNTHAEECCLIKVLEAGRGGTRALEGTLGEGGTGTGAGTGTERGTLDERGTGAGTEGGIGIGTGIGSGSVQDPVPAPAHVPAPASAHAHAPVPVPVSISVPVPAPVPAPAPSLSFSSSSSLLLPTSALEPSGPPLDLDGLDLSDCTMYTTMEPCSLRLSGKVPCAVHLIRARIGRVVVGIREPPTFVAECQGIRMLREAGIPVDLDTRYEAECLAINAHVLPQ